MLQISYHGLAEQKIVNVLDSASFATVSVAALLDWRQIEPLLVYDLQHLAQ